MKTRLFNKVAMLIAVTSTMIISCNVGQTKEQLQKERDSLEEISSSQALTINEIHTTLEEISIMMDSINAQENAIFLVNNDGREVQNYRDSIKVRIKSFEDMLKRQMSKVSELEAKLNDSNAETVKLKSVIQLLKSQIEQKDREIQDLRVQLGTSNKNVLELKQNVSSLSAINQSQRSQISSQQETISSQEEALSAQDKMLSEGFYLVASKRELKEMGIRTGGNLFKKNKTDLSNLPTEKFKVIDIRNFNKLHIKGKNASIISPAPTSSYSLTKVGSGYELVINDVTAFWSISNYLVIQTD